MKFRAFLSDNSEIVFYMAGILTLDSLSSMLANNNNRFILLDNIEIIKKAPKFRLRGDFEAFVFGGLYWTRTSDPIDVNDVLYQLSQQTITILVTLPVRPTYVSRLTN